MQDDKAFERMYREKRILEEMLAADISAAAGIEVRRVRRAPGPDWPERKAYPNRAAWRRACAEWRKAHP